MAVHRVRVKVFGARHDRVGILHSSVHARRARVVGELVSESHEHIFRVVEHMRTSGDLRGYELGKPVEVLVLRLLGRTRVNARRGTSRPGTAAGPGDSFRAGSHWISRTWSAVGSNLGRLGHNAALGVSSGFAGRQHERNPMTRSRIFSRAYLVQVASCSLLFELVKKWRSR